nr:hypothetical protein [Tanacetum cinerariifolium]
MDLFAFIRHADPTEVRIGEKQIKDGQTPLLDSTRGRVVSLAVGDDQAEPSVPVVHGDHNDEVDNVGTHDRNKEGSDAELRDQNEEGGHVVQDEGAASGASGSVLPPKKLREDHNTFSDTGASSDGKTLIALQGLLERSTLAVEVGVTLVTTVPFVTSSVTLTSKHSSHHSSTNVVDVKVSSFDRYYVPPILVMTTVLSTTATAGASTVLVFGTGTRPLHRSVFSDFASPSAAGPDVTDSETLQQIYVPKCNVINDFALYEPKACRSVVDHLAPPTCLSAEVRMRCEHNLRERKRFEDKCARHGDLLNKKDIEIADLKTQLSLKEAEAAEAIRLHGQVSVIEAPKAARVGELYNLKERNSVHEEEKGVLDRKVEALESAVVSKETELAIKAASLESQKDNLTDQVSLLETTCSGLRDQVSGYELFKEQFEADQDEQVKVLSDRVAELDPKIISMDIHLDEEFYPRFLTIIAAIGRAIDKGMQIELVAGIGHGKAGRGLADDAAYDPSAEAKYVSVFLVFRNLDFEFLSLLESQKDASIADIMDSFRLEVHACVPKVKEGASCHQLSIFDVMGPLVDPLSFENLVGEASASGVLVTVAVTTALSTTFSYTSFVPPISVADYGMPDVEPQPEASHSHKIIFEQETLETSSENPATMLPSIHMVPSHLRPSFPSSSAWLASLFRYTRSPGLKLVLRTLESLVVLYHIYLYGPEGRHANFGFDHSFRPYVSENGVSLLLYLIMASVFSFHQTIGLRMFDEGKALADA